MLNGKDVKIMGVPQLIVIALFALSLGMSLADDGKVKTRKESFCTSLVSTGIMLFLLYWGGFFR